MVNRFTNIDNLDNGSQQPTHDSLTGAESKSSRPVVGGLLRVNDDLQLEKGNYTRIVNKVIEELVKTPLLGAELAICLFIIRKTYGFNKKEDEISITQFEKGTGRSRPTIVKALKNLQLVNVIKLVKSGDSIKQSNCWAFNKYYDTWKLVNRGKLVKKSSSTSKEIAKKLVKRGKHTKDNIQKTIQKTVALQSNAETISLIISLFKEVNPSTDRLFGMPPQRAAVDRMLVKFGEDKLAAMVKFLPKSNTSRYAPTITTPVQLERDLGKLIAWGQKEKDIKKTNVAFV
jgi:phage replication O-like protein O